MEQDASPDPSAPPTPSDPPAPAPPEPPAPPDEPELSLPGRVAARFTFLYLLLYLAPFPIGLVPYTEPVGEACDGAWNAAASWVGHRVFGLTDIPTQPTGSGDTTIAFLKNGLVLVLAVIGAAIWSIVAGRRPSRERLLLAGMRVYVRYALAAIMLGYGFAKVFKSQFPFPPPERLLMPFGQISPMGLVWRFMGYSTAYTVFTGLAEVLGGALLFFRRTTTLGALVTAGVMANVAMLNFSYDVPVKLFSSHLLLLALFLLLPDARRLLAVLVLNRPAAPADLRLHPRLLRLGRARVALQGLAVLLLAGMPLYGGWESYHTWGDGAPRHPLYGAYEVESFERDGAVVPPLLTETARWRYAAVSNRGFSAITMDDKRRGYPFEYDAAAGKLTLTVAEEQKEVLSLTRPDPDHLLLEGALDGHRLTVRLARMDDSRFPLMTRGFHWINEAPFHR